MLPSFVFATLVVASAPAPANLGAPLGATTPFSCSAPTSGAGVTLADVAPAAVTWTVKATPEMAEFVARVPLALERGRPGKLELGVPLDSAREVLVGAEIVLNGVTTVGTLTQPKVATEAFETFVKRLEIGSPAGTPSVGPPAGAIVVDAGVRSGATVHAAFPCVGERDEVEIRLKIRSIGTPSVAATRFPIPRLDVPEDAGIALVDEELVYDARRVRPALFSSAPPTRQRGQWTAKVSFRSDERFIEVDREVSPRVVAQGSHFYAPSEAGGVSAIAASLALPTPLTTLPGPAEFVFVIDRSVSFGEERQAAAWAMAHGIAVAAPPESRFSVVEFGRYAKATIVRKANPSILQARARTPRVENGSALLRALEIAGRLMSDRDGRFASRIIVFTDAAVAPTISNASVADAFGAEPVVTHLVGVAKGVHAGHVMSRSFSFDRLSRAESTVVAGVERTGGIEVFLETARDQDEAGAGRNTRSIVRHSGTLLLKHLISPQILEDFSLSSAQTNRRRPGLDITDDESAGVALASRPLVAMNGDVDTTDDTFPSAMMEGEHVRAIVAVRGKVARPVFSGRLWTDAVTFEPRRSRAFERVVPGLIATREASSLSPEEGLALSTKAQAVSPFLSLLGIPKWAPPVVEHRVNLGISGGVRCGCGGSSHGSHGTACHGRPAERLRYETDLLAARLALIIGACRAASTTTAVVSFKDKEILAVSVDAPKPETKCVQEALWQTSLQALVENNFIEDSAFEKNDFHQFVGARTVTIKIGASDTRVSAK